ncbi:hypothetical protein CGCSCA4_v008299 [Colletotrichum siamense]|uniref:Xylanolytic transcriptional activator regulatory domain-containing protein n=1 Tax=Colletotrichum siamense TaxID=690259 RepID=A0A9P5K3R4_COLSI|nr:hypothetical protein CGCSCA4_v008299 [Colletotrichum siamense]KAF4856499.1 hypothetical protein CGCSCA2_v008619 [Colletotrichum siamense]
MSSSDVAPPRGADTDSDARPRVCDNCIRQKVKCNPSLQVTSDDQSVPDAWSGGTSAPTPRAADGLDLSPELSVDLNVHLCRIGRIDALPAVQSPLPSSPGPPSHTTEPPTPPTTSTPATTELQTATASHSGPLNFSPEDERSLLEWYIDTINHAFPVFPYAPSDSTGVEFVSGCSRDLVQTLVVIAAKLSGFVSTSFDSSELNAHIDQILSSVSLQEDIAGDTPTLDQFRKFCLLAFYEFHQFPGQQAWTRIGKLTRLAHWTGLDQLDRLHEIVPPWTILSKDRLEEWRLVWWCIYALDSYASVSTGMPYEIDEGLINTALPQGLPTNQDRACYLPYRHDGLLNLVQKLLSDSPRQTLGLEIHIISITVLRHAGRALRLHVLGKQDDCAKVVADTERRISEVRLALPGNLFNPRRNAFANESAAAHHFRLVTAMHLHMAQMLMTLINCRRLAEEQAWLLKWQQVLEICQDVAAIAKQWNSSFFLSVDPAVSIIAFIALIFLDLHLKFNGNAGAEIGDDLRTEIEHCETVLLLFLEQFAKSWTMPRLLILSFKSFKESLNGPVGYQQVRAVFLHFQSPLHPRWLQFLTSNALHAENCQSQV